MKVLVLCVLALVAVVFAKEINPTTASIINYVNKHPKALWTATENKFASWTDDELRALVGTVVRPMKFNLNAQKQQISSVEATALPSDFDWRNSSKCVHPIRDQAHCGSCWAFAGTEVLSDRFCIASQGKVDVVLSPQDLVSCDDSDYGCDGGYLTNEWVYMVKNGVVDDACMPYTSAGGDVAPCPQTCKDGTPLSQRKYYSKSYSKVGSFTGAEKAIQTEVMTNGPVEAAFSVYRDFITYKTGIYHHTSGALLGGHAVKIIGWGVESGTSYWIVANSWNTNWGEEGTFRIKRGNNECGFESQVYTGVPDLGRVPKL